MTRQRALILEILQHSPKHLTADEIFAIAKEKMPGIARGTVYTCFVYLSTGFAGMPVIGLVREIENAIGTEVRSYQLTIHYICPECREKQAEL